MRATLNWHRKYREMADGSKKEGEKGRSAPLNANQAPSGSTQEECPQERDGAQDRTQGCAQGRKHGAQDRSQGDCGDPQDREEREAAGAVGDQEHCKDGARGDQQG
jgi:hypothetical protein